MRRRSIKEKNFNLIKIPLAWISIDSIFPIFVPHTHFWTEGQVNDFGEREPSFCVRSKLAPVSATPLMTPAYVCAGGVRVLRNWVTFISRPFLLSTSLHHWSHEDSYFCYRGIHVGKIWGWSPSPEHNWGDRRTKVKKNKIPNTIQNILFHTSPPSSFLPFPTNRVNCIRERLVKPSPFT